MANLPKVFRVIGLVQQLLKSEQLMNTSAQLDSHVSSITSMVSTIGKDDVNFSTAMISKSSVSYHKNAMTIFVYPILLSVPVCLAFLGENGITSTSIACFACLPVTDISAKYVRRS